MKIAASPVRQGSAGETRRGSIRIEGINKVYQDCASSLKVIEGINLDLPERSFVSLLGPSGCGKSTLLKLIAGIETPTSGTIHCGTDLVDGVNTRVAYVPQGRGLLTWMSLLTKSEFPLRIAGVAPDERRRKALEWIARVKLGGFEDK